MILSKMRSKLNSLYWCFLELLSVPKEMVSGEREGEIEGHSFVNISVTTSNQIIFRYFKKGRENEASEICI